jgi:hypothetical protein
MDIDIYENIERSADFKQYSFINSGPKGDLMKLVKFNAFKGVTDSHNLALGTIRGELADYGETTDNNDRDKVLATIFHIAQIFSLAYPDQMIFIRGRNEVTTRLYRGAINHGYEEIIKEYFVYGGTYTAIAGGYNFELFIGSKQYEAFLFERRR